MTDLSAAEQQWHAWIAEACAAVGVDPDDVDVAAIHRLSRDIAHGFARPMAPVGSYILGLAVGARTARGLEVDQESLSAALRSTFPREGAADT
ncbi:MAG TPA: DUF6457 domain-containing protein [Ornithinibacter sp.]|nr:DUF6457 domain-containing protein [Ornithinibacter sp.]